MRTMVSVRPNESERYRHICAPRSAERFEADALCTL
jgi:hypothetical protein